MEVSKYVLFANHSATGSIYQTVSYRLENAKNVNFYIEGPINAGVGSSATVWFQHASDPNDAFDNFWGISFHNATIGSGAATSSTNTTNIASSITGSLAFGYIRPEFMPSFLRVKYEISGVASSASAGTMGAFMIIKRDTSH